MSASKSLVPLLIAVLLTAGISGCKTKEQEDPRTLPDLVRVATVREAERGDRAFTGVVTARVQSDLGFRVPGKVTQRFVDIGQTVRAGQPLMRIDVTDYAHVITTQTQNVEAAKAKAAQAAADERFNCKDVSDHARLHARRHHPSGQIPVGADDDNPYGSAMAGRRCSHASAISCTVRIQPDSWSDYVGRNTDAQSELRLELSLHSSSCRRFTPFGSESSQPFENTLKMQNRFLSKNLLLNFSLQLPGGRQN